MMKKHVFTLAIAFTALYTFAQSPRVSLYEEFTGETCPPCAATNPGLNTLLLSATNANRIVAIKWQVPIPSAPTKTWSLYQTNKTEIDWRWKSGTGNYGYSPAINSAPSSKIDGREATAFGATSGHPANLNNTIISKAVSQPSAFNIIITRDPITASSTAAVVNVTVQATMPYTTTSNLVFRTVLVERLIQFTVQPGTNGETKFEDVARKSYPTLQSGTTLPKTWTQGQVMTFSMNCVFPSYIHDNLEIEFVGFIQNDGTQRVEQTARTGMPKQTFDAVAASVNPAFLCTTGNTMAPTVPVKNDGQTDITALTITPYVDGVAKTPTQWTGTIKPGMSDFIALSPFTSASTSGLHNFSYDISGLNSTDNDPSNNMAAGSFYGVNSYQSAPVAEGFAASGWPYSDWLVTNADQGSASWSYATGIEAYNIGSGNCLKYNFFKNTVLNDKDELLLPPVDLTGVGTPVMTFDMAYVLKASNSSDKLEIMASDDCGAHWTTVWSAAGQTLAVQPTPDSNELSAPADWTTIQTNLPGFNKTGVLVKFVVTNKNGNNLFLDNINLASSSTPDGIAENSNNTLNMAMYPNPTTGVAVISINSTNTSNARVVVTNLIGQTVITRNSDLTVGHNNLQLDARDLPSGVYYVTVVSENHRATKKLVVAK